MMPVMLYVLEIELKLVLKQLDCLQGTHKMQLRSGCTIHT